MRSRGLVRLFPALVVAVAFGVAACSSSDKTPTPSANQAVNRNESELADPITLAVGQQARITLSSNRTTGFAWGLAEPLDEKVVKLVGSEYVSPTPTPGLTGAGGSEVWTFAGAGAGQTTVKLKYFRSFDPPTTPPGRQVSVAVTVK